MYENMTEEELVAEIEKQYGKDWKPDDLDPNSELTEVYAKRVSEGF